MTPTDEFTLTLLEPVLTNTAGSGPLADWWRADRQPGEGLAEFLARVGVLGPDAPGTLRVAAKGYVRVEPTALLAAGADRVLRQAARKTTSVERVPVLRPHKPAAPPKPTPPLTQTPLPPAGSTAHVHLTDLAGAKRLPPRIGTRLGRCTLTRMLGSGGGGTVYEALHSGLGISVAVKVLPDGATAKPAVREALRAEARLLAQLNHPNVVRVFDFDDERDDPYLVMELVDGFSLAEMISQCGWLRPEHAVGLIGQAVRGLDAALTLGIVHRDIKPANLLISRGGQVKIADLGLAACHDDDGRLHGVTGGGTVGYMAPERFGGAVGDDRADLYALGVTLFEAVTGRLPFAGDRPIEVMVQHASANVPDPRSINPQVSAELAAIIGKLMAKDPADRYQTYLGLMDDLMQVYLATAPDGSPATWSNVLDPSDLRSSTLASHLTRPVVERSAGGVTATGPESARLPVLSSDGAKSGRRTAAIGGTVRISPPTDRG